MTDVGLVVIGESLVDVIIEPSGASRARAGGSPMNVAIGAARLGMRTTLATAIGDDAHGALVRDHIGGDGVNLVECGRRDVPTNEAVAVLASDGSATYTFRLPNAVADVDAALTAVGAEADHIHTGSLTAVADAEWGVALGALRARSAQGTVSYDPNCRPDIGVTEQDYRDRVAAFVGAADIVKASEEDIRWLYPGEDLDAVAERWLAFGPALVVITLADAGTIGYTRGQRIAQSAPAITVTDTVGAGDSFMAAMLAWCAEHGLLGADGLLRTDEQRAIGADAMREMLAYCSAAAAITCTRAGSNPPTRAELRESIGG